MNDQDHSQIPVDFVLLNVSEELTDLCKRLSHLEKVIFEDETRESVNQNRKQVQDMDLIIQQISDLARTIHCITEVELSGRFISAGALAERLHLKDLKDRLLGADTEGQTTSLASTVDVHFF